MLPRLLIIALLCCPSLVHAQTPAAYSANPKDEKHTGYSFALVVQSKVVTAEGDWKESEGLRAYGTAHPGSYIVFANEGSLMLLQKPSEIAEAAKLYRPLEALGEEQAKLGAKQTPLNQKQAVLGRQMKEATGAEEMRRIGAEQGKVGAEQGALGREQGRLGQEQGSAGRTFYNNVQTALGQCLARRSCIPAQPFTTR